MIGRDDQGGGVEVREGGQRQIPVSVCVVTL